MANKTYLSVARGTQFIDVGFEAMDGDYYSYRITFVESIGRRMVVIESDFGKIETLSNKIDEDHGNEFLIEFNEKDIGEVKFHIYMGKELYAISMTR